MPLFTPGQYVGRGGVVYNPRKRARSATGFSKRVKTGGVVRKSFYSYPVYQNVSTAKAPTRVELKYDVGQITGSVAAAGSVALISTIANGTGSNERIGRKIKYHDVELVWNWLAAANHGPNHAKMWVVYDAQPNGVLPSFTDIFTLANPYCLQDPDTKGRFIVLFESNCYSHVNNASGLSVTQFTNNYGHKVISCMRTAQFLGTTATISDIERGALYVCTVSSTDAVVSLNLENKIQYTDA